MPILASSAFPILLRLLHNLQYMSLKFRELIQKKPPIMHQGNLPQPGVAPPPILGSFFREDHIAFTAHVPKAN
jgi:hypothetical protein